MKKIITSAVIVLLLLACCIFASASGSLKVSIIDFNYSSNTLPAGGTLNASCTLKQIYSDNQEYTFIILVTKNGEYVDHYETSGVLKNYIPAEISGSVSIPSDTTGVLVETFVWESLKNGKAIAPSGTFNGDSASENKLEKLYVDGEEVEIEDNMVFNFSSLTHTPSISPVAKDSSAKVEIDAITTIPQDVNIKVTAQNGDIKNYVLSLEIADGTVTDAYQLNDSNSKVAMGIGVATKPQYKEGEDPTVDPSIAYNTVLPTVSTQIFVDRVVSTSGRFYLVDIPDFLVGKNVVQPNLNLFNNASIHQNKNNGNAETGFFTINRTADVYIYDVHDKTDWIVTQGYEKLDSSYNTSIIRNTAAPQNKPAYRKRFVVEEGTTKTVTLGGATSLDGTKDTYYILVDFVAPVSFVGAKSISIEGIGSVELKQDIYEYDIVVMEDINPVIECELLGVGATYDYTVVDTETGKTATVILSSGDESSSVEYTLNFVNFSEALKELNIDGTLVEGFDKHTMNYTYELPFGVYEPKEVTAEILSHPDIELEIIQATVDTPVAVVTVKNIITEEELVYTVTFAPSNKTTITPSVSYLGSNSGCDYLSKDAYRFLVSIYNNQITVNFLKIDISDFKDEEYINENTKFILNVNAKMQANLTDKNLPGYPDYMTVKAVAIPDTFNWDAESADRATNAYAGIDAGSDYKTYIEGKTPLATGTLPFTNAFENVSLDISSVVYDAIEADKDYAYIALAGDTAQKNDFDNVKNIVFYYYAKGTDAPTLTIEIND